MMETMRRIAWLLSFIMIFSVVFGNVSLKSLATEGTDSAISTAFTINITDNTGDDGSSNNGNKVEYRFDSSESWKDAAADSPINISGKNSIIVKVTQADNVTANVTSTSWDDCMGTVNENGQTFDLSEGQSYVLNVTFTLENNTPNADDNNNPGNVSYTVDFGEGKWAVGDVIVLVNKSGVQTITESDEITLTNFDSNTMEVKIAEYNEDGTEVFRTTLNVTENKTSLAEKNSDTLPNITLSFSVVAKSSESGGDDSNGGMQTESGNIVINVKNAQGSSAAYYRIGDSGEFTQINGTSITLRRSSELNSITQETNIYFKAQADNNQSLDTHDQNWYRKDSEEKQFNLDELANGTSFIAYQPDSSYSVQIAFDGGGNSEVEDKYTLKLQIGANVYSDIQGDGRYKIDAEDFEKVKNNEITVLTQKNNDETEMDITNLGLTMSGTHTPIENDNRSTLEIYHIASGDNYITVNLQSHYELFQGDLANVVSQNNVTDFYITNVTFYKDGYQGIKVEQQGSAPDMFSNLVISDTVDIGSSTQANPQTVQMYFANNTFSISGANSSESIAVELADNINPAAVSISGNTVTFLSNFYDQVTFKVTQNGVTGYVRVQRLGLTIQENNANDTGT